MDGPHLPRSECVICELLSGDLPATFLHRDDRCAVLMDIQPVNPGHLLVVSNVHAPLLQDLDAETTAHLMRVAHRMTIALRQSGLRCEGVNLFLADGEAALQEGPHVHLHVFPRYRGDGFGLRFGPHYAKQSRAALEGSAEAVKRALARIS